MSVATTTDTEECYRCSYVKETGGYPPVGEGNELQAHCRVCHFEWLNESAQCHCAACHLHFKNDRDFDQHLDTCKGER